MSTAIPTEVLNKLENTKSLEELFLSEEFAANDRLLRAEEVCDYLRVTKVTLARWRSSGEGPKFKRMGRSIRYPLRSVLAYVYNYESDGRSTSSGTE